MAGTGRYLDGWTKNWHARWVWCRVWNLSVCNLKVTRIEVLDSSFKGSSTTLSLPNLRWSCSGSKWAHTGLQWCRQGDGAFSLHISTDWQMSCFYVQQHYWIIGEDDIPVRWCQSIVILSPLSLSFPPLQRIRPSWPTDGEPTFAADCCHAISYDRLNEPGETSEDVFLGSVPFRSFGAQNQCLSWQGDLDSFRIGRL